MAALVAALVLLAAVPSPAGEAGGVTVTYLANEGFLIEAGETRVLVDALFGDGLRGYPVVPAALREELENARGRFADVDLILASHEHGDHFDARAVARHLRASPRTVFLSTEEAVADLRRELGDAAAKLELVAAAPGPGRRAGLELPGISVEVLDLHHGRLPVDNLGLVLRLGGLAVLHAGDTDATAADLEPYRELLAGVDVALVPSWLLAQAAWREIGRHLVVMHLAAPDAPASWFGPSGSLAAAVAEIHAGLPEAWVPLEPLASRRYAPPAR